MRAARILLVLSATLVAACNLDLGPTGQPSDPEHETFASWLGVDLSTMTKTSLGVWYKDTPAGTGTTEITSATPEASYRFTGYLKDGTIFAGSDTLVTATLSELPVGWRDGMIGMKGGGERLIVIPSALGYGNRLTQTDRMIVPANSTLVLQIRLAP